jgi:hypothetical protein
LVDTCIRPVMLRLLIAYRLIPYQVAEFRMKGNHRDSTV